MIQSHNKVEKLILHAIVNWQEHMSTLCFQEKSNQSYPFCPKRFIYGCACSFERKNIQRTINTMVETGTLSRHTYSDHSLDPGYKITEDNLNFN
jgi:hypothetical protein